MPKSYLDFLPDEVLERLVRFLSKRPNHENWKFSVSVEDAVSLYNYGGPLSVGARKHFDTLSTTIPYAEDPGLYVKVFCEAEMGIFCHLLTVAGDAVHTLFMGSYALSLLSWITPFTQHCVNVRNITLCGIDESFPLEDVLRARSGCWSELSLSNREVLTPAQIHAISAHCKGLRKFALGRTTILDDLSPIWESIGSTLTFISLQGTRIPGVTGPGNEDDIYKNIKENCPLVTCFDLGDLILNRGIAAANLCAHYGAQLKHVALTCERHEEQILRTIVGACPFVEIHTMFNLDIDALPLRIMGARASQVGVVVPPNPFFLQSLEHCADSCVNLRDLKLMQLGFRDCADVLRQLLACPKPLLTELSLQIMTDLNDTYDEYRGCMTAALSVLAQNTGRLRRFVLDALLLGPGDLAEFARANQELEHAIIMVSRRQDGDMSDEEETALAGLVADLGACRGMKDIVFPLRDQFASDLVDSWTEKKAKIARVCDGLRSRRMCVTVGLCNYLS